MTFCNKNLFTAFAFSLHLLFHCIADCLWRLNILNLYTVYLDSPRVCCLVQNRAHLCIDNVATCERFIKLEFTNDVTKCSRRKIFQSIYRLFNTVSIKLWICNLKINYSINHHCNVISCNYRLWRKIKNLFLQRNLFGNAINKRHLNMKTYIPGSLISSKTFNNKSIRLRNNSDVCDNQNHNQNCNCNKYVNHFEILLFNKDNLKNAFAFFLTVSHLTPPASGLTHVLHMP